MKSKFVKISVAALGLAALSLSPALARSARSARAATPSAAVTVQQSFASTGLAFRGALVDNGRVIGTDPDPNVRMELSRDAPNFN